MLNIYLARHGQNIDNEKGILNGHRDLPLTKLGEEQADSLAKSIRDLNINFSKVYSSPLSRAYQTALTTTQLLGLENPEVLHLLIERDFGSMTGKPQSDIEKLCSPDILKSPTITYFLSPPGSETFPDLLARAQKLIDFLNRKHTEGNILLFSHGDFGKMLYAQYYNLDWKNVLLDFHFGNGDLLLLSPSSPASQTHVFKQKQFNL